MGRRTILWIVGIAVVALIFVANQGDGDATAESVASQACLDAMQQAAAVDEMQDTVSDLYPALAACDSLEAWSAASEEYPDALDGAEPETFARNACVTAPEAAREGPLCQEVAE